MKRISLATAFAVAVSASPAVAAQQLTDDQQREAIEQLRQDGQVIGEPALENRAPGDPGEPADQSCSRCYEELERNNADCRGMQGLDWQVCRDAARTEYQRCSKGC